MGLQKVQEFRKGKVVRLLDSSGNNLIVAMRDDNNINTKRTKKDKKSTRSA
jgi:hypothetical protein